MSHAEALQAQRDEERKSREIINYFRVIVVIYEIGDRDGMIVKSLCFLFSAFSVSGVVK
jgi:hypothetical protein